MPRDDESCWAWDVTFNEDRPLDPDEIAQLKEQRGHNSFDPATFRKYGNEENLWLQDREEMKTTSWSGLRGIFVQDNAVQEGMGAIVDRTREHLGTADQAIIVARRLYISAAMDLVERGIEPAGVETAQTYKDIESFAFLKPASASWKEMQPLEPQFNPAPPLAVHATAR